MSLDKKAERNEISEITKRQNDNDQRLSVFNNLIPSRLQRDN